MIFLALFGRWLYSFSENPPEMGNLEWILFIFWDPFSKSKVCLLSSLLIWASHSLFATVPCPYATSPGHMLRRRIIQKNDQFHWSIIFCFFWIILSTIDNNKVFQVCELCINEVFTLLRATAAATFQARWNTTVRSVEYRQLDHCVISHFKGDAPQLCLLVYTSFPLYRYDIVP